MRDQLSRLPELHCDTLHECCQLQWQCGLGQRNPRLWLFLHLRHWLCRNHMQCLRLWLLWVPDLLASSMHERRRLQRQRSLGDGKSSSRLYLYLRYWIYWLDMQHMRFWVSELPNLFPDSRCLYRCE
jgi:hypothetical protein